MARRLIWAAFLYKTLRTIYINSKKCQVGMEGQFRQKELETKSPSVYDLHEMSHELLHFLHHPYYIAAPGLKTHS